MTPMVKQQGEVHVRRVEALPEGLSPASIEKSGVYIVSHSESGHHHVLDAACVEVMERTRDVPAGMAILYAIVREPTALSQTAANPHGQIDLDPGIYEMRISREFNPFAEQARRVAD